MSKTILVIDDDEMLRELLSRVLAYHQLNVITAADGPTGIAKYESEKPDLVVVDVAMPGMSGIEVTKCIRAMEQRDSRPRTPLIVLTAYARTFIASSKGEAGVDSYVTKPVTPDELMVHLRRFLGD